MVEWHAHHPPPRLIWQHHAATSASLAARDCRSVCRPSAPPQDNRDIKLSPTAYLHFSRGNRAQGHGHRSSLTTRGVVHATAVGEDFRFACAHVRVGALMDDANLDRGARGGREKRLIGRQPHGDCCRLGVKALWCVECRARGSDRAPHFRPTIRARAAQRSPACTSRRPLLASRGHALSPL